MKAPHTNHLSKQTHLIKKAITDITILKKLSI